LAPVARVDGEVLAVVAARVGSTRLIDNTVLHANENGTSTNNGRF
jgi:pantothenate synthetase